jgi:hypothetical protein
VVPTNLPGTRRTSDLGGQLQRVKVERPAVAVLVDVGRCHEVRVREAAVDILERRFGSEEKRDVGGIYLQSTRCQAQGVKRGSLILSGQVANCS